MNSPSSLLLVLRLLLTLLLPAVLATISLQVHLVLISQSWQVPTKIWSSNLQQIFRTGTLILLSNGFGEKFSAILRAAWKLWKCLIFLFLLRYFVLLSVFLCLEGLLDNRAWLRVKNTSTIFLHRNVRNFQSRFIAMYRSFLIISCHGHLKYKLQMVGYGSWNIFLIIVQLWIH